VGIGAGRPPGGEPRPAANRGDDPGAAMRVRGDGVASAAAGFVDALRAFARHRRRRVQSSGEVLPWMKYLEIEIVEEILRRLAPRSCLEWGAGYSTLVFPGLIPPGSSWLAVEHDEEWAAKIDGMNTRPNVTVSCVLPNHHPWTDEHGDGSYDDLTDYVEYPSAFGPFDFILIDGRARSSCLERAVDLLTPRGVVVLHDAQRTYYHAALRRYKRQVCFRFHDRRKRGLRARALWIGGAGAPIESVLDVAAHERVWRLYDAIGTVAKVL
jgi:hypothetical protein